MSDAFDELARRGWTVTRPPEPHICRVQGHLPGSVAEKGWGLGRVPGGGPIIQARIEQGVWAAPTWAVLLWTSRRRMPPVYLWAERGRAADIHAARAAILPIVRRVVRQWNRDVRIVEWRLAKPPGPTSAVPSPLDR